MKKIKLSSLSTMIEEIAPKAKADLPPLSMIVPYADASGSFVVCPLDTLARKIESDLSKLRTFAKNNGLTVGEYSDKARQLVEAFASHVAATAVPMIDHDRWETEVAAKSEGKRGSQTVATVPSD
ncbi:MAG: hypothetical protein ACTSW7_00720 [Candidatus Thorarchaeota archaeon]|nr:hypothetical protein [Thermoplasmatales archaeon]